MGKKLLYVVSALAALLSVAAVAGASNIGSPPIQQHGRFFGPFCISRSTGVIRAVRTSMPCKAGEIRVKHFIVEPGAGPAGKAGRDGHDGSNGSNGATGAAGRDGKDGGRGSDGAAGAAGKDGAAGADGVDGIDGAPGILDVSLIERYSEQCSAGGWLLTTDVVDESGENVTVAVCNGARGANGSNGTDGAAGAPGVDGKDGADGKNGVDGKDGAPGVGVPGADGAAGAAGADGKDGKDGLNGADGRDGTNGTDGTNGKDGVDGAPGAPGADGKDGLGNGTAILCVSEGGNVKVVQSDGDCDAGHDTILHVVVVSAS